MFFFNWQQKILLKYIYALDKCSSKVHSRKSFSWQSIYILGKYSNKAHVLYLAKHPILFPLLNPIVKSCPCPHVFSFGLKMINIKLLQNYAISKTGFKISKTSNKICQFVPLVLLYVPQTFELMQISQILQRCLSLYSISMNTSSLLYLVHGSISNFSMNNPG